MRLLDETLLRTLIKKILVEGRLEDISKKFPDVDVETLAKEDPSTNLKYLQWMAKQVSSGFKVEDVAPSVKYFHDNTIKFDKKDINAYKTASELEDEVKKHSSTLSNTQTKKLTKQEGAEKVYEDDEVVVYHVLKKSASCLYGSGTKWCITMKDTAYFEQYTSSNVVFFFVIRKQPLGDNFDKVAFSIQRGVNNEILKVEIFDASDHTHDEKSIAKRWQNGNKIISLVKKLAVTYEKSILVKLKENPDKVTREEIKNTLKLFWDEPKTIIYVLNRITNENLLEHEDLQKLARHNDFNVRATVASNSNLPTNVQGILSQDDNENVLHELLNNKNVKQEFKDEIISSKENLNKLIRHGDLHLINHLSDEEILQTLEKHEKDEFKYHFNSLLRVIDRPSILDRYADYDYNSDYANQALRMSIVQNEHTTIETLAKIIEKIPSDYVLNEIVKNKSFNDALLDKILKLPNLKSCPVTLRSIANLGDEAAIKILEISELVDDSKIIDSILEAPFFEDIEVLKRLLAKTKNKSASKKILSKIAVNKDASAELLEKVYQIGLKQKNTKIFESIASNENCTPELFEKMLLSNLTITSAFVEKFIKHPNAPTKFLVKFLSSKYGTVRKLVAKNEKTPFDDVLKMLAKETDASVFFETARRNMTNDQITQFLNVVENNPNFQKLPPSSISGYGKLNIFVELATNPLCGSDNLERLSNYVKKRGSNLANAIANNPNVPNDILP